MGNLGKYQDIVTDAKRAGGVDNLISEIEDNAVAGAAPGLIAVGAGVGALAVLATCWGTHRYGEWKSGREARAAAVKTRLRAVVGSATDTEADQASTFKDEAGPEGEIQ